MMINNTEGILPENSPQTTRSYGPIQSENQQKHINYTISKDFFFRITCSNHNRLQQK